MNKYPSVYIILVTYRMRELAKQCLLSLRTLAYPNLKIIVVDNNSGDDIARLISNEFPEVILLQSSTNLGYTGGNNIGIKYAVSQGADYTLILNPDTIVSDVRFLNKMVAYAQENPQVGIAGPRVYYHQIGITQNTILYPPGLWRNIINWFTYRITPQLFKLSKDEFVDAPVLNGVCLLLRTTCLNEIGLFDENIFMYIEDADLDYRAHQNGWEVRYLPYDSVVHLQKQTGYHMTSLVSFLLKRNSVYYLNKIGKSGQAWVFAILSLVLLIFRGVATFKISGFVEYLTFSRKLALAYRQILLKETLDDSFGPPFASIS